MKLRLGFLLRVLGTAGGLLYIATKVDFAEAKDAFARIPLWAFGAAMVFVALNVLAATVRWRVLMTAYGATAIPPMRRLAFLYFVSFFYNNYLPGAVVGDVGRGVVTRDAFTEEGATGALAVVLVERALGLLGLFVLLAGGILLSHGAIDTTDLWWWTALGCAGSIALVVGIAIGRRIARFLPGFARRYAERLPLLRDRGAFAVALVLSVGTQILIAAAGWVLLAPFGDISFTASLLVVPLAAATAFLPITVGGAGAREAIYVSLCGRLFGMAEADALAASLALWLAHLLVAAGGGLAQLAARRATVAETASTSPRSD